MQDSDAHDINRQSYKADRLGSHWRQEYWQVRQIKLAQLAFSAHYNIVILTNLLTYWQTGPQGRKMQDGTLTDEIMFSLLRAV